MKKIEETFQLKKYFRVQRVYKYNVKKNNFCIQFDGDHNFMK